MDTCNFTPRHAVLDIGGEQFASGAPGIDAALAKAYREQRRPRCLCRPEAPEMYVARLGSRYVFKRMPDTGSQHAPSCPSFEPPADASGLKPLLGSAIIEDPSTGTITLRLDFPMSIQAGRPSPVRGPSVTGTLEGRGRRLSLRALLHYLWDEAKLTRWEPSFNAGRGWGLVRDQLLDAAEGKLIQDLALSERLYVPEPFCVEQRDELSDRRRMHWINATAQRSRQPRLALLVGEVKEIVPARHDYKTVIKHVPDVGFAMDESLYRGLERRFAQELALWSASEETRLMMIAAFGLNTGGMPTIHSLCLMTVTRRWLPVQTANELQLVDQLIRAGRSFSKVMRYDIRADETVATVAMTDRGAPAPLLYAEETSHRAEGCEEA